jgi:hypothetical protein
MRAPAPRPEPLMPMDDLLLFAAIGFAAQLVDGALGMAYGITASTTLLSIGVPPAVASACVHAAEVFTTGVSGLSHWRFGNVKLRLFARLAIPGAIGGAAGAYLLTSIDGDTIQPFVSGYLLLMGVFILWKALHERPEVTEEPRSVTVLALGGGFLDAIGGGGWGPIVASTLIGNGHEPRYTIGSVNAAEFFVTSTVSAAFIMTIGLSLWPMITGLIIGGALAAPFAAYVTQKLPDRPLMILVAVLVILLSIRGLIQPLSALFA